MRVALLLSLLLIVSWLPLSGAVGLTSAPLGVVALPTLDGNYIVAWTPGAIPADSYRIYGVAGAGFVLVDEVPGELGAGLLAVPAGYTGYAVSGTSDGEESPPQMALLGSTDCVYVETFPLPPHVSIRPCDPNGGGLLLDNCEFLTLAYGLGSCGPAEKLGPVRGILGLP